MFAPFDAIGPDESRRITEGAYLGVRAANHPNRREYWIGSSTAAALVANAVAPGLLDRYLARTGYRVQQTSEPTAADQPATFGSPPTGRPTTARTADSTGSPSEVTPKRRTADCAERYRSAGG